MENFYKAAAAAVGAVVGFFAGMPPVIWVLLGVMTLDYLTGLMCGWMGRSPKTAGGGVSSTVAREGLMRKAMILLVVGLAALLDLAVSTGAGVQFAAVTGATCMWFVASEGVSILENAGELGVPIPKVLKNALEMMKDSAGDEDEEDKEE